jgi:hypothetical protein
MNQYTKKCSLSDNWIQFEITDKVADMKLFEVDFTNFRLFCKLLSECIDELTSRGVATVRQMVTYDDYIAIIKPNKNWTRVSDDPMMGTVIIECQIETFLTNFAEAHNVHPQ